MNVSNFGQHGSNSRKQHAVVKPGVASSPGPTQRTRLSRESVTARSLIEFLSQLSTLKLFIFRLGVNQGVQVPFIMTDHFASYDILCT